MKREGSILSTSVLQLILLIFGSKRTQLFWQNIFGLLLEKKKKKKKEYFPPNQVSHPKNPQLGCCQDLTSG